ncbi:hypothetical protein ASF24_13895 [Methylobacterium sp. Leaf86]|uniref:hypothetical protein n=1 Tax=Methylobacterium sp. Leaf86 TaxID=1736242 RepID=UPI0006F797AE|nr:hypothetical protein [Methylobacterium sp. Leaf86]KQO59246.1 hypothetical protein ASF24_13895 [Methylobacterium sp. Leaf86]
MVNDRATGRVLIAGGGIAGLAINLPGNAVQALGQLGLEDALRSRSGRSGARSIRATKRCAGPAWPMSRP